MKKTYPVATTRVELGNLGLGFNPYLFNLKQLYQTDKRSDFRSVFCQKIITIILPKYN